MSLFFLKAKSEKKLTFIIATNNFLSKVFIIATNGQLKSDIKSRFFACET
jgi:hypothetical protein